MSSGRSWVPVAGFALMAALMLLAQPASASSTVQYFALQPGTPAEMEYPTSAVFTIPVFVVGEPAGGPANRTETSQTWQSLSVTYVGPSGGLLANWSVSGWSPGEFDLVLNLTSAQVSAVERGQAEVALNSTVIVGGTPLGASGAVVASTLLSATLPQGWWSAWFGINTPPPDMSPTSANGIVSDLAWWGDSTAGRASYAATTIVAVSLYLWEGHKLARKAVSGDRAKEARGAD